ncbi:DoxX family protein [Gammaproteobacteria bacterium AB-CW1]|uniref:DoxX family protein n=1 Tax=Natronospira elongata TaxID=3110268 RepID=A0AAP6MMQ3_9GAMM|nr:DoxX family protein [Gammaproteobacteria bacterium AB-CW1]
MPQPTSTNDPALEGVKFHSHWLLRIAWGSVFIYMGIDKFMGGGLQEFATAMELPVFAAFLVALAEIAAGLLVLLGPFTSGWITRLGALAAIPVLLGAIFIAHWGQWHFMATPDFPMGGMMFQATLLFLGIYLLIRGNDI